MFAFHRRTRVQAFSDSLSIKFRTRMCTGSRREFYLDVGLAIYSKIILRDSNFDLCPFVGKRMLISFNFYMADRAETPFPDRHCGWSTAKVISQLHILVEDL